MSNGYFSQYKSPNITIVPTMSCSPSSPKRRKTGNNIIVPITNNNTYEKQKLKLTKDDKISDELNVDKKVHKIESLSKSPSQKASWASNYLQSIGLDKKTSIWNRKIPRKTSSQRCVISEDSPKIIEATPSSTCAPKSYIEKSTQLKIPKNIVTDSSTFKDSKSKNKYHVETKSCSINHKSKKFKQSKNVSTKPISGKSPKDVKNNKTVNISTCKNKNIPNDSNKIKIHNTKEIEAHKQSINLYTSSRHSCHAESEKAINTLSQKDLNSKFLTIHSLVRPSQKNEKRAEKSNIKSVVVKQNYMPGNKTCIVKTKQNQTKSDSAKLLASDSNSNYKEKYKNPQCSTGNVTSTKNVMVTKKYDMNDLNKSPNLKKIHHKTELKSTVVRNKAEINNKKKPKDKITKSKSLLTPNRTIKKSPIKRKIPKAKGYRKIKLVINLICNNKTNPPQRNEKSSNESSSVNTTCTVSNIDLDFLNDFDIDEIVESLDTCEQKTSISFDRDSNKCQSKGNIDRHYVTSNIHTGYNNTDAIDLIKTLKGEEDDDLMRISIENAKEFVFSSDIVTQDAEKSHILDSVSKKANSKISKNHSSMFNKMKDEGKLEIPSEAIQTVPSNIASDLNNIMIPKEVLSIDIEKSCNSNKDESAKETQRTILTCKVKESNDIQYLSERATRRAIETFSIELNDKKNNSNMTVKEEQNDNPSLCDIYSNSVLSNIKNDSYNEMKLQDNINENSNQETCEYDSIHINKFSKLGNNLLEQQGADKLYNDDQSKNRNMLNGKNQKVLNMDNIEKIVENKKKNCTDISNILKTEINSKDILSNSTEESPQKDNTIKVIYQHKSEKHISEYQKYARKQEENKAVCDNGKCIKAIEYIKNNDDNKTNSFMNQKIFPQHTNAQMNPIDNNENQNNLPLNNNIVKEEDKNPDEKVQSDKLESNKEKPKTDFFFTKNKQKDLSDINNETVESQKKLLDIQENAYDNIKSKGDLETALKLEERLFAYSGSKYSIISIIHTGKFSKIFKCKHPNGKYYALKMPTINTKYNLGKEKKQMLNTLVSDIPKNNLFIVCLVKAFNVVENWYFLMEYYPKNLDQALSETGKPFSIEHIQDFARQLVMAVMVLRNKNMVHLDIKPKHILINSSNNMLKLCGFDNLCYINKIRTLPNLGTVNYRAPEVILGYESGFEIDVWSTGLVLYEMAANQKLFPGVYNNDILYKQICTLGCVPYEMIKKSRFGSVHFVGTKFMRKSGFKGQSINILNKFYKNNKLCDSIYDAYFENWGHHRTLTQQNCDIGKLSLFVKLLQKMLTVHPESRLPIEFVYANPFIYDAYSYQEW